MSDEYGPEIATIEKPPEQNPLWNAAVQPRAPAPVVLEVATKRFGPVDLQELGPWLVERLRKRYPDQADRALLNYLRGWLDSNESLFLRRGGAVALARVAHAPFLPCRVEEVFVLCLEGETENAALLYQDIRRWAESVDAMEVVVERFTDVPRALIKLNVGTIRSRNVSFVDIGR